MIAYTGVYTGVRDILLLSNHRQQGDMLFGFRSTWQSVFFSCLLFQIWCFRTESVFEATTCDQPDSATANKGMIELLLAFKRARAARACM